MSLAKYSPTASLPGFKVEKNQHSVSGLSSGAYMAVQLHLAHSTNFVGAGIIAGGPYRCVESLRDATMITEDAYTLNALTICMNPLTPTTAPNAEKLASLARQTAAQGKIDPIKNLADQRLYIFTGTRDEVVSPIIVKTTKKFYEHLGVKSQAIKFIDTVPAGHAIITDNPEDSPLEANNPPYLNFGGFAQSHEILDHIYPDLNPPADFAGGALIRFEQSEFLDGGDYDACAFASTSLGRFGYAYIPAAVKNGAKARGVHIALHGCKQGFSYVNSKFGRPDIGAEPPFGNRYITTTGYNTIAESNNIIVLYPQATGDDDGESQNPDGCWDWWGYTSTDTNDPDYYSKNAIQIRAIHAMLTRLCSG